MQAVISDLYKAQATTDADLSTVFWDHAAAKYLGPDITDANTDRSQAIYARADKRAANYGTLDSTGEFALANKAVIDELKAASTIPSRKMAYTKIVTQIKVIYAQCVLRYAYLIDANLGNYVGAHQAEGQAFWENPRAVGSAERGRERRHLPRQLARRLTPAARATHGDHFCHAAKEIIAKLNLPATDFGTWRAPRASTAAAAALRPRRGRLARRRRVLRQRRDARGAVKRRRAALVRRRRALRLDERERRRPHFGGRQRIITRGLARRPARRRARSPRLSPPAPRALPRRGVCLHWGSPSNVVIHETCKHASDSARARARRVARHAPGPRALRRNPRPTPNSAPPEIRLPRRGVRPGRDPWSSDNLRTAAPASPRTRDDGRSPSRWTPRSSSRRPRARDATAVSPRPLPNRAPSDQSVSRRQP